MVSAFGLLEKTRCVNCSMGNRHIYDANCGYGDYVLLMLLFSKNVRSLDGSYSNVIEDE